MLEQILGTFGINQKGKNPYRNLHCKDTLLFSNNKNNLVDFFILVYFIKLIKNFLLVHAGCYYFILFNNYICI